MMRFKPDWKVIFWPGRWLLAVLLVMAATGLTPAQERPVFRPVNLTNFYTEIFNGTNSGKSFSGNAATQLPHDEQTLDGTPYHIGGRLEVTGLDAARNGDFRNAQVEGIPIGQKAARLHLLHGAAHGVKDGIPMSSLVLHYAGGETRSVRLTYGVHARNWMRDAGEKHSRLADPNSILAWSNFEADSPAAQTAGTFEIASLLTQKMENSGKYDFIKGWSGADSLSIIANSSDQTVRVPGNAKAHGVAVHPSPKRRVLIGWRSPVAATLRVEGAVQRAHADCGSGVDWTVELQHGATRRLLASGTAQSAKEVKFGPFVNLAVEAGDMLAVSVGPRGGNHSCDLTEVDLNVSDGKRAWNLAKDVSPNILAGNPHADRLGNAGVWYFFSEPDKPDRAERTPDGVRRLFKTTFDNPLPDREIVSLDVVSLFGKASPIIFALTLEEKAGVPLLQPATGKPTTKSAGHPDSAYRQELLLRVTGADGKTPLTNAVAQLSITDDASTYFFGETAVDASGTGRLAFPVQQTLLVRLVVTAPGHALEVVTASPLDPKGVPREMSVRLARGSKSGGVVQSLNGSPVSDAEVMISRLTKIGEADFTRTVYDIVSTDAAGRWVSERLPRAPGGFSFNVSHPDYNPVTYESAVPGVSNRFQVRPEDLTASLAVMKMPAKMRVNGLVTDARGAAMTNVDVVLYTESYGNRRGRTDTNGAFLFVATEPSKGAVLVQASNFAPVFQAVEVESGSKPIRITPVKGLPLKARVFDQDGTPVAGASVELASWNNTRLASWRTLTDDEGRFQWPNAPIGVLVFSISKNNYSETYLRTAVPAVGEAAVTLRKYSRHYGSVVDAETGALVNSLTLIRGQRNAPDEPMRWNRGYADTIKRGNFSVSVSDVAGGETCLLLEASGYLPLVSDPITKAGYFTNRYALRRGSGPRGVVLRPDGTPATNVTVVLADPVREPRIEYAGAITRDSYGGASDVSDHAGRFELAPRADDKNIFAAGPSGFAQTTVRELAATGKITLQPWGHIRGALRVGDKAQPYQLITLHNRVNDVSETGRPILSLMLRTRVDEKGNFAFDKIPPGEWQVSLQNRFRDISGDPMILSHGEPVVVKPGLTNVVTLGGGGISVTGQVETTGIEAFDIDWRRDAHTLVLQVPGIPDLTPPNLARAKNPAERQKLMQEFNRRKNSFWSSEKGRAVALAQRTYALVFQTNGTFHAHNIPPDSYQLTIAPTVVLPDKYTSGLLGLISRKVVVRSPVEGGVFDFGTLKMDAKAPARPGHPAPSFVAKTFDGRTIRPEDFRGKFLLIDFWSAASESRHTELQTLRELSVQETNRLVVLSLNLDADVRTAESCVKMSEMSWLQGYLGSWAESGVPSAYGVEAPGLILVDPEGRLATRVLNGEYVRRTVYKFLDGPHTDNVWDFAYADDMDGLARLVRAKSAGDLNMEAALFKSIQSAASDRRLPLTASVLEWGTGLVTRLLTTPEVPPRRTAWINTPLIDAPTSSPWAYQVRPCSDGRPARLVSSFPISEYLTGTLSSSPFLLPPDLSFYLAGHDGNSDKPRRRLNIVRLIDATTKEVLREVSAPGSDTAQRISWNLGEFAGRRGYIEATDALTGGGYAWLALGRFQPALPELDLDISADGFSSRQAGADLVRMLKLVAFVPQLSAIFADRKNDEPCRAAAGRALIALSNPNSTTLDPVLTAVSQAGEPDSLRGKIATYFTEIHSYSTGIINQRIADAMPGASPGLRSAFAGALTSGRAGCQVFIKSIEDGKISPVMLREKGMVERLRSHLQNGDKLRIDALLAKLPPRNAAGN